jgi:hypothetical protein
MGALQTSGGSNAVSPAVILSVGTPTTTNTPIPTLSQWAMIALTLLLALAGFTALRRRKK